MKERDTRDKSLKQLIEESQIKDKEKEKAKLNKKKETEENLHNNNDKNKNNYKKLKENFISESIESNLKVANAEKVIPKTKVNLV